LTKLTSAGVPTLIKAHPTSSRPLHVHSDGRTGLASHRAGASILIDSNDPFTALKEFMSRAAGRLSVDEHRQHRLGLGSDQILVAPPRFRDAHR
jgi:hypothetical protein